MPKEKIVIESGGPGLPVLAAISVLFLIFSTYFITRHYYESDHVKSFYVSCVKKDTFAVFLETDGADVQVSQEVGLDTAEELRSKLHEAMVVRQQGSWQNCESTTTGSTNCTLVTGDYVAGDFFNKDWTKP